MRRPHRWQTIASAAAALALATTLGAGTAQAAQQSSGQRITSLASSTTSVRQEAPSSAALKLRPLEDSCSSVEANLAAYAKAGRTQVECLTPLQASNSASRVAGAPAPSVGTLQLPSWCTVSDEWLGDRTEMCLMDGATVTNIDTETGEPLGTATFQVNQLINFAWNSLNFTENYEFVVTEVTGSMAGTGANLTVTCTLKTTCLDIGGFEDVPLVEGTDEVTTLQGSDTTSSVDTNSISYTLSWDPITLTSTQYTSPDFRCDSNVAVSGSAGCIVPGFTPDVDMSSLPDITQNILAVWAKSTMEYGNYGLGNPLTRDTALRAANRAVACPSSVTSQAPSGTSCDEYPFARTDQGASQVPASEWGYAFVPTAEQQQQAQILANFVQQNRIMDGTGNGDAYWVVP